MRIITGGAKTGKTSLIYREIQKAVENGQGRQLLIVPEQYSHEAEREMCAVCGPSMSLYAEVMSFTGLSRWALSRFGGAAERRLDRSGRILCMAAALRETKPLLNVYESAVSSSDMQLILCLEAERLSQTGLDNQKLRELAADLGGTTGEKIRELVLLEEAAEAVAARSGATLKSPLELLAEQITAFGLSDIRNIYFDGFFDFTGLEKRVIFAMLHAGMELTFCLPTGEGKSMEEHLLSARLVMEELQKKAEEEKVSYEIIPVQIYTAADQQQDGSEEYRSSAADTGSAETAKKKLAETCIENEKAARRFLTENLFRFDAVSDHTAGKAISLFRAKNPIEECEIAAAQILKGIRDDGLRWRDIALAVRGFEEYRVILEDCFRRYAIPLYLTKPIPLTDRLLPIWLQCTYDVVMGHWETDDVCAYLRCGMSGFSPDDLDLFCSYLQKWRLKERDWDRKTDWRQHPDGYDQPVTPDSEERLRRINGMRCRIQAPLKAFSAAHRDAETGKDHVGALMAFLSATRAEERLRAYAEEKKAAGKLELYAESLQVWEQCIHALEQFEMICGSLMLSTSEFRDLFFQVLAQIDISTIPVSLDRVSAGDFDRIRKRKIKRLFILGCSDDRLPAGRDGNRLFSDAELDILSEHGLNIGGGEAELWREYAMIYHTVSLPSDRLSLSYSSINIKGELALPSFIYSQISRMFRLEPEQPDVKIARLSAFQPALGLAAGAENPEAGVAEISAAGWFQRNAPERLEWLSRASGKERGRLSRESVEALYGRQIRISPTHMDQFIRCRFAYYCRYGLRAKADDPAAFQAPEVGNFFHFVLQHALSEICSLEAEASISEEMLQQITEACIDQYLDTKLGGLDEKDERFRYLFQRLRKDASLVVRDAVNELSRSDFKPLSFELDISDLQREFALPDCSASLSGIADRVDGWEHDGKLYLRVVDYKTGKKEFHLSDVLYGMDTQMLLYLFLITEASQNLYGLPGVSAGISYLPAREEQITFSGSPDEELEKKERMKRKRRSGLLLSTNGVTNAWEHGVDKQYTPAGGKNSSPFISPAQMDLLRQNVRVAVIEMAKAVQDGSIQANPIVYGEADSACTYCKYGKICRFADGENGEHSVPLVRYSDEEVWKRMGELE